MTGGLLDIRRTVFSEIYKKQMLTSVFSQVTFVVTSQRNKWFLSSVLFFGLGCALFFLLPARVSVSQAAPALILLICGFWISRRVAMLAFALQLAASMMAGVLSGAIHTELGPKNIPVKTLYSTEISGTIIGLEPRGKRIRATLQPSAITGLEDDQIDWNIRLSFLGDSDLAIGDRVTVKARLFPLKPPSVPGDPDFARNLYFSGIGATGFVFGRQFDVQRGDKYIYINDIWQVIKALRQSVSATISDHISTPEAGIAKALIIGERGEVEFEIAEDLRKSGLAHLLAISGLHMGLLCGTVFFLIRFGLAAIPTIALKYPIKKWSAMAAMFAGLIYLGLSGATIPTQRAFVMLLVVWVALLLDRRAISLRLVGVAAIVVLLLRPDAVLGASFQLSFAAVGALVAFYDGPGRTWLDRQGMRPWYERAMFYLGGLLITGLIVTAVTAPIIGFHFGRISMLGIIANLVAIPVMAFWVMPLIVASLALMPFGLAGLSLVAMAPGLTVLLKTASLIADQDWGLWYVSGLDGIAVGGLLCVIAWCLIWRDRWAMVPIVPVLIAVMLIQLNHQNADMLVAGDRESWAVFDDHTGTLHVSNGLSGFQKSIWMGRFGIRPEEMDDQVLACKDDPCFLSVGQGNDAKTIVIASQLDNPFYACRNADIVANLQADLPTKLCETSGAKVLIDDDVLWWQGGVALRVGGLKEDSSFFQTVRSDAGGWPWIVIGGKAGR